MLKHRSRSAAKARRTTDRTTKGRNEACNAPRPPGTDWEEPGWTGSTRRRPLGRSAGARAPYGWRGGAGDTPEKEKTTCS